MMTWLVLLTICIPWLGSLVVWWAGDKHPGLQHTLASGFSIVGGLFSLGLLLVTDPLTVLRIPMGSVFGDFTLVADGLGVYLAIIAAVIGCLTILFSNEYMKGEAQLSRYYALVLLFIGAMIGLVLAGSLLLMFIFWEITAFCSYALISFHNDDPKAVAGGIKAMIITQLGGAGLLAGAIITYTYLNSYEINIFLANTQAFPPRILGLIAFGFLIAAAAKSAQVPFHTWLPDAMEAPTPISALIHAATMVNAGVYLLARFYPAFESVPGWALAVTTVGLLSALLAALMAVVANDLKRALAYSTISQLGYMVYAIGTGTIFASQFHLLSHSVFKALLFLAAGAVVHTVGTRDMYKMGALSNQMPFTRTVFIIGVMGLAGIPIANGFFSKELVLEGGLENGQLWAYIGMLVGVGITALYSLRMVSLVFYQKPHREDHAHDAPTMMRIPLSILACGTLTTWLLIGPFSQLLASSLLFHSLHAEDTLKVVVEIITTPATWLALMVILLGFGIWLARDRLTRLSEALQPVANFISDGLGFEWLNQQVIHLANNLASALSATQTGQLNWNIVGIVSGLIVLLIVIAWGA